MTDSTGWGSGLTPFYFCGCAMRASILFVASFLIGGCEAPELLGVIPDAGRYAGIDVPQDAGQATDAGLAVDAGQATDADAGQATDTDTDAGQADAGLEPVDAGFECIFPSRGEPPPFIAEGDEDIVDPFGDTCCFETDPIFRDRSDLLATWSHFNENGDFIVDIRQYDWSWELNAGYFLISLARDPENDGFHCSETEHAASQQYEAFAGFGYGLVSGLNMAIGCHSFSVSLNVCEHVFVSESSPVLRIIIPAFIPTSNTQIQAISGERYYVHTVNWPGGVGIIDYNVQPEDPYGVESKGGSASVDDFVSFCDAYCPPRPE